MLKRIRDLKGEEGAVVAIFAILMSVVVISLFAIVFDVSAIYAERRVVQNAADASVLATTQECALSGTGAILNINAAYASGVCTNPSYAQEFAGKYANLNSPDSLTDVSEVCGTNPLNPCGALTAGQFECHSVDAKYKNYVRVKTSTRQSSGTAITALFAPLTGSSNTDTKVVGCAQAAWGNAESAPVIMPMALPICDWQINGSKVIQDFASNSPVFVGGCSITDLDGNVFNYASPTKGFSLLSGLGCPGIDAPTQVRVGDTLQIESSIAQVQGQCSGGASVFRTQLSKLVNANLFLPVVTSVACQSNSNNCQGNYTFKVASFFGFKYLGSKWKNQFIDGGNPNCPIGDPCQTNSNWPSACDATRICLYGTFERSVVPGADVSLDAGIPAIGAMAVQLLP